MGWLEGERQERMWGRRTHVSHANINTTTQRGDIVWRQGVLYHPSTFRHIKVIQGGLSSYKIEWRSNLRVFLIKLNDGSNLRIFPIVCSTVSEAAWAIISRSMEVNIINNRSLDTAHVEKICLIHLNVFTWKRSVLKYFCKMSLTPWNSEISFLLHKNYYMLQIEIKLKSIPFHKKHTE